MGRRCRIVWTPLALDDLRSIGDYMSRDSPEAARRLAETLKKSVLRLARFPRSGREVPEFRSTNLREIIVGTYRIVFESRNRDVVVLRVWHGKRDLADSPWR